MISNPIIRPANASYLCKTLFFALACQALLFATAWLNDTLINLPNSEVDSGQTFNSWEEKIVLVLMIAPLLETLIFNLALNELLFHLIKRPFVVVIISSVCFGLIHTYSLTYMFFTFLGAIGMNAFYFHVRENYSVLKSTLFVVIIHFNHNLIGILLEK